MAQKGSDVCMFVVYGPGGYPKVCIPWLNIIAIDAGHRAWRYVRAL